MLKESQLWRIVNGLFLTTEDSYNITKTKTKHFWKIIKHELQSFFWEY